MYALISLVIITFVAFVVTMGVAALHFGIGVLLFGVFNYNGMWPYIKSESQERIVSLRDDQNSKLEGSFILGCGTMTGYTEDSYVTYSVINEYPVTYKRKCFPINKTVLVEDDNTYVKYTTVTAKRYKWLLTPMPSSTEYELHVPKGTIIQKFKVE